MKVLVGDSHGIGHAGLFPGLHQAAAQRDDALRKNQNRRLSPHPAQVTQGLWEPSGKALQCCGPRLGAGPELSQWGEAGPGGSRAQEAGGPTQMGQGTLCPRKGFCSRLSVRSGEETASYPIRIPSPTVALGRGPSP